MRRSRSGGIAYPSARAGRTTKALGQSTLRSCWSGVGVRARLSAFPPAPGSRTTKRAHARSSTAGPNCRITPSVNLSEHDAPAVMERLRARGVGIEAGLASVTDAERLHRIDGGRIFRILIEISEQDFSRRGRRSPMASTPVLEQVGLRKLILLHGAGHHGLAVRGRSPPSGGGRRGGAGGWRGYRLLIDRFCAGNAALVSAAVEIFKARARAVGQ